MSVVATQLERIRIEHGMLTPQIVVDDSRPEDAPLHDSFDWDDSTAGEAWRRHQATGLIRSVRYGFIRRNGEPGSVRAYHSVKRPEIDGRFYEPVQEVVVDPITRDLLLGEMRRDWVTFKNRYHQLEEFVELMRRELGDAAA